MRHSRKIWGTARLIQRPNPSIERTPNGGAACDDLFFFYGWLDLAPLRNQSTNFGNPALRGVRWAAGKETQPLVDLWERMSGRE